MINGVYCLDGGVQRAHLPACGPQQIQVASMFVELARLKKHLLYLLAGRIDGEVQSAYGQTALLSRHLDELRGSPRRGS